MSKDESNQKESPPVLDEQTLKKFDRLDAENQQRIIDLTRNTADDQRVPRPERELAKARVSMLERRAKAVDWRQPS